MNISFTGTHGIGKTTLALWLAEVLESTYIPEFAREFLEQGTLINTPMNFINFETTILKRKIETEQEADALGKGIVSDRSYLDYAVYLKNGLSRFAYDHIKDLFFEGKTLSYFFNDYESSCRDLNRKYDLIFFVTPFTEFISPEFDYREKNPFATNIIQDLLFNEYREDIHQGKVVLIKEKGLIERKKMIIQTLKEKSLLSWNQHYINEEL
ncbi:MAG: ATP/GTP-binding protein [Brevinema sp.]